MGSENRLAWLDERLDMIERAGEPVDDGYRIFMRIFEFFSPKKGRLLRKQTR